MQNALFSVLLSLRNDPDRYLLIDRMELTPFTTTIINYNSFLASRRPPRTLGNEQFVRGRVLETTDKIFNNLQRGIVDNSISTSAGLENRHPVTYQALPYSESPSYLPRYFNQNSIETRESSNNY